MSPHRRRSRRNFKTNAISISYERYRAAISRGWWEQEFGHYVPRPMVVRYKDERSRTGRMKEMIMQIVMLRGSFGSLRCCRPFGARLSLYWSTANMGQACISHRRGHCRPCPPPLREAACDRSSLGATAMARSLLKRRYAGLTGGDGSSLATTSFLVKEENQAVQLRSRGSTD